MIVWEADRRALRLFICNWFTFSSWLEHFHTYLTLPVLRRDVTICSIRRINMKFGGKTAVQIPVTCTVAKHRLSCVFIIHVMLPNCLVTVILISRLLANAIIPNK